jgi:hypothetical protein
MNLVDAACNPWSNPIETDTEDHIMTPSTPCSTPAAAFDLLFPSLFQDGRGYAFPCDAQGHVDLDALSPQARLNYLYVRTLIGRDYATPAILPHVLH